MSTVFGLPREPYSIAFLPTISKNVVRVWSRLASTLLTTLSFARFATGSSNSNVLFRRMIQLSDCCKIKEIRWRQSVCDAYIIYITNSPSPGSRNNQTTMNQLPGLEDRIMATFHDFLESQDRVWDFEGRYLFFGSSKSQLEAISTTTKVYKSMNAIFVRPDLTGSRLEVYTHWQYSWKPFRFISLISNNTSSINVDFFPDKVTDLQRFPLTVFIFAHAPTSFGSTTPEGEFVPVHGMDVLVIRTLAKALNFSVIWRDPGPHKWGFLLENGTYTGIVEKVERVLVLAIWIQIRSESGDLGLADIFMDHIRTNYITYTSAYTFDSSCFLTPSPIEVPKWQALTFPFTLSVWIALFCSMVVATLLLPGFARITIGDEDKRFSSLAISLLYTVAMFTNQSVRHPEKTLRVFVLFLMVMGFVAAVSFSCNLTAYMMVKAFEDPITSFKELDESGLEVTGFGNIFKKEFGESLDVHIRNLAPRYEPTKSFDDDFK
ncbi:uncharacterized protein LOC143025989 [Oratosquilla oratoria]|uniref:uncharacterized protein LOC143025989 n=1 Tax=Oratosquilla oratoria TaxID=337810 RepID=UPI003F767F53